MRHLHLHNTMAAGYHLGVCRNDYGLRRAQLSRTQGNEAISMCSLRREVWLIIAYSLISGQGDLSRGTTTFIAPKCCFQQAIDVNRSSTIEVKVEVRLSSYLLSRMIGAEVLHATHEATSSPSSPESSLTLMRSEDDSHPKLSCSRRILQA